MVTAVSLKERVISAAQVSGATASFSPGVYEKLRKASEDFSLAPDEFVDVNRLPPGVNDLDSLFNHLRSIKVKLQNRDQKTKNADWDVAKDGSLRQYKLFACALNALHDYVGGSPNYNVNLTAFVDAACLHARSNAPSDLAKNGKILWEKTFEAGTPRTVAVMKTIVYFCQKETADDASKAVPPTPAEIAAQVKAAADAETERLRLEEEEELEEELAAEARLKAIRDQQSGSGGV
jgi:hypothetical protein